MSARVVEVTTGNRLHFGMMSFGQPDVRQFGGMGVMIDSPGVRVRVADAANLEITGEASDAVHRCAQAMVATGCFGPQLNCRIDVLAMPTPHAGLGSGTQLALAVAAGVNAFLDRPALTAEQLARLTGRGRRSAVGLYGFLQGGLILEAGKLADGELSPLVSRMPLPTEWRFLLVRPTSLAGLSGEMERQAFERVPPVPASATERMCREAVMGMLPAGCDSRFDEFSASLFRYGQEAGRCFAPLQHGLYASPEVAAVAESLAALGVVGLGQSSWGPTVFALLPHRLAAEDIVRRLRETALAHSLTCDIASALNEPARIEAREI